MASLEAALTLLGDLPSKDRRACLEVLIRIFRNVVNHPDESKYRILKITNKTFNNDVWRHEPGRLVMVAAGWMIKEETVQLPSHVDLTVELQILLDNREVKPDEKEWVEETKVVVPNAAKLRDEELREKALAEKKKEMAALKKEMAERKAIAERIRAEHRRDIELKQVKQAAKAVPLGKGEAKKMSDMLPKNGGG
ncbi:plant UBX domain-containing protein 2-like isoform X2 [Homarus americanus]|nr:plant UBX domain-containing protein 2-like isoform X2 [Homarus americanus]XP_042219769.1 plant UBX domain-containing protein 2-like isoform X2 [Homarus americanus]XP_042219770.1 plant UBX domain-containing protein 2-like isoform X2 [Homarus americanus]XP_042219771.1 plant UBX domain-containing protein 2-like isoform X2 [Homarus americanus]